MKTKSIALLIILSLNLGSAFAAPVFESMINLVSCRQENHHFDLASKECIYCAKNLKYDPESKTCKGYLSPIGKCIGDDHFHAATKECMYCAKGFAFDEKRRTCEPASK